MLGVYTAGGISGGHLNPAVTLANCVLRKLSWKKLPVYWFCQTAGCFMGAAIIYGNYRSAIQQYEGGNMRTVGLETSTAGLFCTYPASFSKATRPNSSTNADVDSDPNWNGLFGIYRIDCPYVHHFRYR